MQANTYIVHVDICTPVMSQNKVSDHIRTLDGVWICVVRLNEPGVLLLDEFPTLLIRPELEGRVLAMQVD